MLIGHHQAQTQLATLLGQGRFPHALILHGPRGIGKSMLAQALAYRLICGPAVPEQPAEEDMFGAPAQPAAGEGEPLAPNTNSPQYHQLQAGSCPDYHVLMPEDGKKSIGIKQVQSLLETLLRSADTARTVIVDSLDDLTPEAANTILKTLEEPRPGIYFLLVAHQLSAVLPTIRSRCRLMRLAPLSREETEQVLQSLGENPSLAAIAAGSPGSVTGSAAKTLKEVTDALAQGTQPPLNNPAVIPALMQHVASLPPTLANANTYAKLADLRRRQQAINLPLALTNQTALAIAHVD